MRRIIAALQMSVDGFIEAPNGELDWVIKDDEEVWRDVFATLANVLFGRRTYDGMAAYWSTAMGEIADFMNSVPKVVFSNTPQTATWNNTRLVKGRAEDEVVRPKQAPGKDLFIFGSAELADSLTKEGLIDEYRIGLNPLVLGGGTPLFKPNEERMRLKMLEARPMEPGVVLLRYARA